MRGSAMVYSNKEWAFIIEHYFREKLYVKVKELFQTKFPDRPVPNKTTIHRIVTHILKQSIRLIMVTGVEVKYLMH